MAEPIGEVERARASILGAIQRQDRLAYAEETVQDVLDSLELDGFKIVGRDREQVSGEALAEMELDMRETAAALNAENGGWMVTRLERWADSLRASRQERPPGDVGKCPRDSDWCDGRMCVEHGIECEQADDRTTLAVKLADAEDLIFELRGLIRKAREASDPAEALRQLTDIADPLPVDREQPEDRHRGVEPTPEELYHDRYVREQPAGLREALVEAIMEAQADIQTPLGLLRLNGEIGSSMEDRLERALARLHVALAALGRPMYDPAIHPDVLGLAASPEKGDRLREALEKIRDLRADNPGAYVLHVLQIATEALAEEGERA